MSNNQRQCEWIVGQPGGPNGPFYSVVSSTGEVIAAQIYSNANAQRIAHLPYMAKIIHHLGRYHLVVNDIFVATEGDPCRDGRFIESVWTKDNLDAAAEFINAGGEG